MDQGLGTFPTIWNAIAQRARNWETIKVLDITASKCLLSLVDPRKSLGFTEDFQEMKTIEETPFTLAEKVQK